MEPMTLDFILNATGGQLPGACYNCRGTQVSSDTHTLRPGSLFIALRGERFDGSAYLETAFSKGAVVAVAARKKSRRAKRSFIGGYCRRRFNAKGAASAMSARADGSGTLATGISSRNSPM